MAGPALMFVFLLVANILMVNLLIARFNATFIRNNANSKEIWMFQRYGLILQYEMRPILPPPFIIITHIYLALKFIKRRCKGKRDFYDNGLKLFLSHEDTEKLHDFEEECMEDLYREKDQKHHCSTDERIKVINERVENMSLRLDDMNLKENHLRLTLSALDHRMSRIDDLEDSLHEAIRIIKLMANKEVATSQESLDEGASVIHPRTYSNCSSIEGGYHHIRQISIGSSDGGERTQPSPILIHSKRRTQAEQLKKLTSNVRQRQLSGSEFPMEDVDHFVGEVSEPPPAINEPEPSSTEPEVKFLLGDSNLNNSEAVSKEVDSVPNADEKPEDTEANEQEELSSQKQKIKNFAAQAVRFVDPVVHNSDDSNVITPSSLATISVMAKLDSDTHTVSQLPETSMSEGGSTDMGLTPDEQDGAVSSDVSPVLSVSVPSSLPWSTASRLNRTRSLGGHPLTLNTTIATSTYVPCTMPQSSACFTTPNPDTIPQSAARDLSSMFSTSMGEYTSITDNIDTSCIGERSPPRSPTSTSSIMFSVAEGYHEVETKLKERSKADSKQLELKQAEEAEHQRMETLIRHRLRQISQPDWLKLMGRKRQHQRHSPSSGRRTGSRRQDSGSPGGGRRGGIRGVCHCRGGGGGRAGDYWLPGGGQERQCSYGGSGCSCCQGGCSGVERHRRRSHGGNTLVVPRSGAHQDLSAEPGHRRHSVTLQVPVLADGTIRRHSITLPVPPLSSLLDVHNGLSASQVDIQISLDLEGSSKQDRTEQDKEQVIIEETRVRSPSCNTEIVVTPPSA